MISIKFAVAVYMAALSGCYDGDTCTVHFVNFPALVRKQTLRFEGFDTPERHSPKCAKEATKAEKARSMMLSYLQGKVILTTNGKFDLYGRLLVRAPELQRTLLGAGLAKAPPHGRRAYWC